MAPSADTTRVFRARQKAGAAPKGGQGRATSQEESALVSARFVDGAIEWKVIAVDWPEKHREFVVSFYDVARARPLEWTVGRLVEAKTEEFDGAPPSGLVEYSSMEEIEQRVAS